jgi:hypothetical protein
MHAPIVKTKVSDTHACAPRDTTEKLAGFFIFWLDMKCCVQSTWVAKVTKNKAVKPQL